MHHHNKDNKNMYRGLAPFLDNDPSHKELFDMGQPHDSISKEERKYRLNELTPFPEKEEYKYLKEGYEKYYWIFSKLGLKLINYLATGLGKPRNFFDDWFEKD